MSLQTKGYWESRQVNDEQRDWPYASENWIKDYELSIDHPHRQVIIDELKKIDWQTLVEIGCNCGPNMALIHRYFPTKQVGGFDPSQDAIDHGQEVNCSELEFFTADASYLKEANDNYIDVLLADASLMYVPPEEINEVMDNMTRAAKHIIIVERFSEAEENNGHIWSRNYTQLLADRGFGVQEIKMTEALWPTSINWQKYGKFFIAHRI